MVGEQDRQGLAPAPYWSKAATAGQLAGAAALLRGQLERPVTAAIVAVVGGGA